MFAFLVARRYLRSNPWQTALLIAGVALGVTAFVFITALIQGLAVRLTDDVTAKSAHVSLEPADRVARVLPSSDYDTEAVALVSMLQRKQIRTWAATVALLESQVEVTAISPQITGSAVLVRGETQLAVAARSPTPHLRRSSRHIPGPLRAPRPRAASAPPHSYERRRSESPAAAAPPQPFGFARVASQTDGNFRLASAV